MYSFSDKPVAEFYGRQFYSITNSDGELVAYSEKVFEVPHEVRLLPGLKTLIFEKAILKGGEIRGGVIRGGEIRGGEIWGGVIRGGEIRGGEIRGGVIRGGEIRGGEIWGGVIRGGEIRGGEIRGGEIWGGEIWGGEIRGGEIWGGVIRGGEIRGGEIRGGVIRGGEIRGGVIRGGEILGGVVEVSMLQIQGTRHFMYATPSENGEKIELGIGCKIHPLEWWEENYRNIGVSEGYSDAEIEEYATYIALFRARYFPEKGV